MSTDTRSGTINPLAEAARFLEMGDLPAAERAATALLAQQKSPDALHLLGLVRMQQDQLEEAASLLRQSLTLRPGHPFVLLNLAKILVLLNRDTEAEEALEEAVAIAPDLAEAWFELGELEHRAHELPAAESCLRKCLALEPGHRLAHLSLGLVLREAGRPAEAEKLLAAALASTQDPPMKAALGHQLAHAQYDLGNKDEALTLLERASLEDPRQVHADIFRAAILDERNQPADALALLEGVLRRDPASAAAHAAYNDLLFRLSRDRDFLKSYDRAPQLPALQSGKADFLLKTGKAEEAHALYARALAAEPGNLDAALGAATALNQMGRSEDAIKPLEWVLPRHRDSALLLQNIASTALQAGDPQKAAAMAERALARAPDDQGGLAVLGSAWRLMGDERDEVLNGYDELIQVFDLEPPQGFSSIAAFHAELSPFLADLHPDTREPLTQSLRSGSQTRGNIFGAGHDLAERLRSRIAEALDRYIAQTKADPRHPFRRRRAAGFRFTGSWSSRLRDCGYHVNHIHPGGWISSCYYVGVPDAVRDETEKQGWIKFGEPSFDIGLGIRRAIQPKPGRLVLFPSYVWHGTIPFRGDIRTTIAFDAVPQA